MFPELNCVALYYAVGFTDAFLVDLNAKHAEI
jgi:hypothetical protein